MLGLADIHAYYGNIRALRGITLSVESGEIVGECGNSGNSTEPHVHIQVTDSIQWRSARGLPMTFNRGDGFAPWIPAESEIVQGCR